MALPLLPIVGPFLLKRLVGRIGEKWAGRAAAVISIAIAAALLFGCAWWIRADGWNDGRQALLAEQAAAKAAADAIQRERERQAEQDRRDELRAGADWEFLNSRMEKVTAEGVAGAGIFIMTGVNTLAGLVIGYYFGKAAAEPGVGS